MELNSAALVLVLVAFAGFYIVWSISRKIVRLGFLLLYSAVGAVIVAGVQIVTGKSPDILGCILAGLIIGTVIMAVRSKIMRAIGSAATLGAIAMLTGKPATSNHTPPKAEAKVEKAAKTKPSVPPKAKPKKNVKASKSE